MCTPSSLPPAPPAEVRAIADRLVGVATCGRPVPSLKPAITEARLAVAKGAIGGSTDRIRDALQDLGVAVLSTLARFEP